MANGERIRVLADTQGISMTRQADAIEADINHIINRYTLNGEPLPTRRHFYGDFTNSVDFHQAQQAVAAGNSAFEHLPLAVRNHCRNDPGVFLDLVHSDNPADHETLAKLGLVELHKPETANAPIGQPPAQPSSSTSSSTSSSNSNEG